MQEPSQYPPSYTHQNPSDGQDLSNFNQSINQPTKQDELDQSFQFVQGHEEQQQQLHQQFHSTSAIPPMDSNANNSGVGFSVNPTGYQPDDQKLGAEFLFDQPQPFYSKTIKYVSNRYQLLLDASTPHWAGRWAFSMVILIIFMLRIVLAQGWYVICYGLSIYYLNLFIAFLSPKIDPAFQAGGEYDFEDQEDSASGPMLPTRANDEFKPFIRRLPEFKFWLSATKATLISLFLTMFEAFDLPVFWPILLIYFILLFVSMMRQQIKHMIKYGYVPWDKGKRKYGRDGEGPTRLFPTSM